MGITRSGEENPHGETPFGDENAASAQQLRIGNVAVVGNPRIIQSVDANNEQDSVPRPALTPAPLPGHSRRNPQRGSRRAP